jgi:hypothetical protein
VILLCVCSIGIGVFLIYLSPYYLIACGIAYIVTGTVGIVFAQGLTAFRCNEMAFRVIAICVVVTVALISLIVYYVMTLGFGSA